MDAETRGAGSVGRAAVCTLVVLALSLAFAALARASTHQRHARHPAHHALRTCFWGYPVGQGPAQINMFFPDSANSYWGAILDHVPPGSEIVLHGRYAHARYEALTSYNGTKGIYGSLLDTAWRPDPGSTNPFIAGHRRDRKRRSFTLHLLPEPAPAKPRPNTVYMGTPGAAQTILALRIYLPDRGTGPTGGENLPRATLRLADGTVLRSSAACRALGANRGGRTPTPVVATATWVSMRDKPGEPLTYPASDPTRFFANYSLSDDLCRTFTPDQCNPHPVRRRGPFADPDNGYLRGWINSGLGQVFVMTGKAPTTPHTHAGEKVMGHGQMRYWSFCQYESPATWRAAACLPDERVPQTRGHRYTIVISRPGSRPRNATARCGVAWMPFSPRGDGTGDVNLTEVTFRNLLASPGFHHSASDTKEPGDERAVMGPYLPHGDYMSRAQFERRGCRRGRHAHHGGHRAHRR